MQCHTSRKSALMSICLSLSAAASSLKSDWEREGRRVGAGSTVSEIELIKRDPSEHWLPLTKEKGEGVRCGDEDVERGTLALMTEVLAAELPQATPAVLSGPGFAKDVARGLPTATTIASPDPDFAQRVVATIGLPTFRPYVADDVVGAEIGGAVKDVGGRPQQVFEIGLEARVAERGDESIEDVCDGAGDGIALGKRSRVGFVLKGAEAVELQLGENVIGR